MKNNQVTRDDKHFGYSDDTQAKIVAMLLYDEAKFSELAEIIQPEMFDNPVHQDIIKIAYNFYKKYKRRITEDEFFEELNSLFETHKNLPLEEYLQVVKNIIELGRNGDFDFVYDKLLEFAKYQAMKNAILDSVDIVKSRKGYEKILKMFQRAVGIGESSNQELDTVVLSEVEIKLVSWFWENRIPEGKLSFIVGNPGEAKSFFTMMLAAHTTTGAPWPTDPPCPTQPKKGKVIILSAEDGVGDTIAPRIQSCGGLLEEVTVIRGTKGDDGLRTFNLRTDLQKLEHEIKKKKDVRLIIIDPVSAYLGVGNTVDPHKDKDVRVVLAPVATLAEKYNVTIIGILHLNKTRDLPPIYRVIGSIGFVAAARSVWLIERDRLDRGVRHFVPIKYNLSNGDPGSLSFSIEDGRIKFLKGESRCNADTILALERKGGGKRRIAQRFLTDLFVAEDQVSAEEAINKAKTEGISEATLNRAKNDMRIESKQVWDAKKKSWVWEKPPKK